MGPSRVDGGLTSSVSGGYSNALISRMTTHDMPDAIVVNYRKSGRLGYEQNMPVGA